MKTILAVDDDQLVLEIIEAALTAKGYAMVHAETGAAALQILKERPVDLVLLDLNLADRNGFSVLREVDPARGIPVLFVSGCTRSFSPTTEGFTEVWNSYFALGMTDILYKPFAIDLLYEKIEALIGVSEVEQNEPAR